MNDGVAASADAPQLRSFLDSERARVEVALDRILPSAETEPGILHQAMRHSVFAGGKRLRPLLVIAAARACGGGPEAALPAACAVELIHTYSLIHDDLPSFDDELLRRGQPTCHALFGEPIAILAGDALQALAFEQLGSLRVADADSSLRTLRILARAAGSAGMCGGQALDLHARGNLVDLPGLRRLHAAKTGALLTGSVLAGGVLAGADAASLDALRGYGDAVGLAFQVVDDLLDVEGTVERLGKRPGGDAERDQPTFPSILGVDATRREIERLRQNALDALAPFTEDADVLRGLAHYVVDRQR
jgi:geranylgeranyl pyrophosphate synthase